MKEKHIQIFAIAASVIYGGIIVWLYANEPKTFGDVATKATVTVGTYEIDKVKFAEGLRLFRAENYRSSREFFAQADPEKRDPATQFYVSYSFYRQGFGKIYNDDSLFKQSFESLSRVSPDFKTSDDDLKLKSPSELRNEIEQGLQFAADDLNPLKVLRERK